jgi:DNA-binding CsgD family transcriptional regulator
MQEMVLNTAKTWGLTPREQEVWLLHQNGYTYSKIAEKLTISKNTVKKHMSSIHGKRRAGDKA